MATSRARALALSALVAVAAACGGTHASRSGPGFGWLQPGPAPSTWRMAALTSGDAALPVPAGWRVIHGDPGTVSAAVYDGSDAIVGYLNATPRQGDESLRGWARFRTEHNADEGDADVRTLASAGGLHFRTGLGSCVEDRYRTSSSSYREIACLVRGRHASTVIVAAATPSAWGRLAPTLERAVSAFST
ncbi:MAG: hypothetical protein ACTHNU_05030 [Gaiellales bacterium]